MSNKIFYWIVEFYMISNLTLVALSFGMIWLVPAFAISSYINDEYPLYMAVMLALYIWPVMIMSIIHAFKGE